MADYVDGLTDEQLRTKLAEFGFPVMPITSTTRKVMAKKLKLLIDNKNKTNSEGRRSLVKYSSEEESDTDVKVKSKNRRATLAAPVMQPPPTKTRKSTKIAHKEEIVDLPSTTSVTSETRTSTRRRTTKLIKPQPEEDFETGSDSEPEIIGIIDEKASGDKASSPARTKTSYGISKSPGRSLGEENKSLSSLDYTRPASMSYTKLHTSLHDAGSSSIDRLNQIRSRLSMDSSKSSFGTTDRKVIGSTGYGDGDGIETPFLSNFTRRLSQLSTSPQVKTDYNYKNDIIKEHDSNGSSYNRLYLSRAKKRDYPADFKTSQEKNIFKNNVVSLALLGIAVAFFIGIFIMYMGMRSENLPAVPETDYILPVCVENEYQHRPGVNCVLQQEMSDTINLFKALMPELLKRAIHYRCTDSTALPFMTDQIIVDFVLKNYAPRDPYAIQKDISNLQVLLFKNPKWGISVIKTEGFPNDVQSMDNMDQIFNNREKNLALVALNPEVPWRCIILNKVYTLLFWAAILAVGLSITYGVEKTHRHYKQQRKQRNDQIYLMVEKIIDILQSSGASESGEDFLAVNHVRDMIIPPQERTGKSSIWDAAVKFLEENESRVRTEIQIVSGEEFHVWRWLGNPNLNMSGSKVWQGQAFETQVGSVNSLPCSPTPCLKVRGFDERERNTYAMREAVLSKCASQCKILHCDVDPNSNCVYLKCANPNEAAIAYRNLHGWWYDGNLLTVKYLRLERYMQRFSDSPSKGPPFLQASTNAKINNEWTSKDD